MTQYFVLFSFIFWFKHCEFQCSIQFWKNKRKISDYDLWNTYTQLNKIMCIVFRARATVYKHLIPLRIFCKCAWFCPETHVQTEWNRKQIWKWNNKREMKKEMKKNEKDIETSTNVRSRTYFIHKLDVALQLK